MRITVRLFGMAVSCGAGLGTFYFSNSAFFADQCMELKFIRSSKKYF